MRSLVSALSLSLLGSFAVAQDVFYSARLTGDQEVPPVVTTASGWGIVKLETATSRVTCWVAATGLSGTASHLHMAPFGQNGGVILPFTGGPTRWSGSAILTAAQIAALKAGGTYLNVHSTANPGGQIRGQVVPATSTRFTAVLDGSQEVPPTSSTAKGTGVLFLHEPDNVAMYVVQSTGLANVTAAHVHAAPKGNNGGVVFPLNGSAGQYCGIVTMTSGMVTALKADGHYFNIHTSTFPGGEIRGQILKPTGADAFVAVLSGANEVPPNASKAIGWSCVDLTPEGAIRYRLEVSGMTGTAAHIHLAPKGQNGGVVFPFTGGPTVWQGTTAVLTAAQLADLRNGNYYVNCHSAVFPGGEIRDQLVPAERPTTFGGGCKGTNNLVPEIGGDPFACIAGKLDVQVAGAPNATAAVLLLGGSRSKWLNVVDLPFALDGLGMMDCTLLVDFGALPLLVAATDGRGCGGIGLQLPLAPGLRGVLLYAQWLVLDKGANTAGLTTSNALAAKIQ